MMNTILGRTIQFPLNLAHFLYSYSHLNISNRGGIFDNLAWQMSSQNPVAAMMLCGGKIFPKLCLNLL